MALQRETLKDGGLRLSNERCSFTYKRLRPGVLLLIITGFDRGELGDPVLDELTAELGRYQPLELFVDATEATGVTKNVSDEWTAWFQRNQARLKFVRVLVASRFFSLIVQAAKLFSRTGELIQVDSDRQRFEDALSRAFPAYERRTPARPEASA